MKINLPSHKMPEVPQVTRLAFNFDEMLAQAHAKQAGGEEVPLAHNRLQVLLMHERCAGG
jgi:hypothetical protein